MATRKSASKKKKTSKKRKPKVKLDNKKVMALAAIMIFICAIVLSVSFLISYPEKSNSLQTKQSVIIEEKKDNEIIQKNKNSDLKNNSSNNSKEVISKNENNKIQTKNKEKVETKKNEQNKNQATTKTIVQSKNSSNKKTKETVKNEIKPKVENKKKSNSEIQKSTIKIPQSVNNAKLCFIIDDGGQKTTNLRKYTTLPFPITIAVLPQLPFSRECARIIVADKKELMLHQPMQAQNLSMNPGRGAILPNMSLSEVYAIISKNLSELGPHVKGFNNHEGSLITCDLNMMGAVLDVANDNNIYFVDSRTSKDTMASFAALERDMKILEREVFIDDIIDRNEMIKQILRGIDIANKKGKVIMIGHVDKSAKILPGLLSEIYPELKAKGYRLVFPSQLL